MTSKDEKYWEKYSNLQKIKHQLICEYLKGWFPILSTWQGRIIYLDTHAGRGTHKRGEQGSPVVALNTLLEHSFREKILQKCEVLFYFIEMDEKNITMLRQEVNKLGALPQNVKVEIQEGNCFEILTSIYK